MEGSFEAVAAWWDEQAGDQGDFYHRHLILPALLAALGDVQGLPVLDLGCGNGMSSRVLARRGARVTGVDLSPSLVHAPEHARRKRPWGSPIWSWTPPIWRCSPTGASRG